MGPKNIEVITNIKVKLTTTFDIVDMQLIRIYLGLKIEKDYEKRTIKLLQPVYIKKVLTKYYFDKINLTNTPIKKIVLRPNLFTKAI